VIFTKRKLAMFLAAVMAFTTLHTTALFAATTGYSDLSGHWAEDYIMKWSTGEKPVLYGYDSQNFGPDDPIKSVELDLLIGGVLGRSGAQWEASPAI
jgi:hypothetical protein